MEDCGRKVPKTWSLRGVVIKFNHLLKVLLKSVLSSIHTNGDFLLFVTFFAFMGLVLGSVFLWIDMSGKQLYFEEEMRVSNAKLLHSMTSEYRTYISKLEKARGAGVDVTSIESQVPKITDFVKTKKYQMAAREFSDLGVQVDELLAQKEDVDRIVVGEKKKILEVKVSDYKGLGVETGSIDQEIVGINKMIDDKKFSEAETKIATVSATLDNLLAKKKEADRIAAEAARKLAQTNASESLNGSSYVRKNVDTTRGSFIVDVVSIDLSNSKLKIITDAANDSDCTNNCPTMSLMDYVSRNGGFAGINGTYFCPSDYPSCAGQVGSFNTLLYNSRSKKYLNDEQNKWSVNPLFTFDWGNGVHFYQHTYEFGRGDIQAVIANHPALLAGGQIAVNEGALDEKSRSAKMNRGGLGVVGRTLYIVVGHGASVPDLAYIMQAIGVKDAINLDGGGSSALVYNGSYKVGPGRNIPNALVFAQK